MVEYFSFEDVLKELELSEEDLKRMVSEGELRAFRDENKMKFKKEDVDNLKKGRITEPTIILPTTPGGRDETVLDLDIGQETAPLPPTTTKPGGKTKPAPPPVSSDTDDLLVQPAEEKPVEPDETFIEEETDTGLTTEPLKLADEVEVSEGDSGAVTAETEPVVEAAPKSRRTGVHRRRATAAVPVAAEEELERRRPSPVWTALVIVTFVIAAYSCLYMYELAQIEGGKQDRPSTLTAGMAEWTLNRFWTDANWRKFHESKIKKECGDQLPPFQLYKDPLPVPAAKESWYNGPSFMKPRPVAPLQQAQ